MTPVLLTGGSGYVAFHILKVLLERGYSVVTTVRSQAKVDDIRRAFWDTPVHKLGFVVIDDMAREDAFVEAFKTTPAFEAVIHPASPFTLWSEDIQRDVINPAILGTTNLLHAIKRHAPTVKRVVITSSTATIAKIPDSPNYCYTDSDWNDISLEEALTHPFKGYSASKILAERAAWEFMQNENPGFTLTTMCLSLVLGPVLHNIGTLEKINTSRMMIRDFTQGKFKAAVPRNAIHHWVDVRDSALAHVRAIEVDAAAGRRFIVCAGNFTNIEVARALWSNFPGLRQKLPEPNHEDDGKFNTTSSYYDSQPSEKVLGIEYRSLERSVVDMAGSLIGW